MKKNEKDLNSDNGSNNIMPEHWKMIGLGMVGGILVTVGIFILKNWIGNAPPIIINLQSIGGSTLIIIGIAALFYARYGDY